MCTRPANVQRREAAQRRVRCQELVGSVAAAVCVCGGGGRGRRVGDWSGHTHVSEVAGDLQGGAQSP